MLWIDMNKTDQNYWATLSKLLSQKSNLQYALISTPCKLRERETKAKLRIRENERERKIKSICDFHRIRKTEFKTKIAELELEVDKYWRNLPP